MRNNVYDFDKLGEISKKKRNYKVRNTNNQHTHTHSYDEERIIQKTRNVDRDRQRSVNYFQGYR